MPHTSIRAAKAWRKTWGVIRLFKPAFRAASRTACFTRLAAPLIFNLLASACSSSIGPDALIVVALLGLALVIKRRLLTAK